ncbi:4Fe-4S binding domain-containing protein [Syntrophus gentianae]|uniref:4Fe-4S binding domain-containing protein n=1 Tax=Syntrophus gentianae TaxID=43775 RepID=A0A1H7UCE1_9BACT|nr:4Fe-4S dicluster domain-containing protein [Syntrophus gentianae]SEL94489.1 4Fe-4S binding domain-containing protein [Syntrophus gentianae]
MGHLTMHSYRLLQKRMDRSIPGIYDSNTLYELLKILFTDEEARLCSVMPLTYFSLGDIAKIWGKTEEESEKIIQNLAGKGLVYCYGDAGGKTFLLSPAVLGFFEFSLMRTDGKFDRKRLSELYYQYNNVEGDFIRQFASIYPPMTRIFVQEDAISDIQSEVLSYERASAGIEQASFITVGTCFCRHKMEHMGLACDNPQDVCLTFNNVAKDLASQGIAREISKSEAHAILNLCIEKGLVQIGDNTRDELVIICNCCGCCCDILLAYKRYGSTSLINPTNYIASIEKEACSGCGVCAERCPVDAISVEEDKAVVNRKICLGCGVCTRFCPVEACKLETRPEKVFVPANTFEKVAIQSIDQGKTGNFLFDNQASLVHKFLRALVNSIIKLPPVKRFLLQEKVYSKIFQVFLRQDRFKHIVKSRPD